MSDICCQITDLEKQYIELVDKYLTLKDINNIMKADSF